MFTLIAMGTGVAWAYSVIATLAPGIFPAAFRGHDGAVRQDVPACAGRTSGRAPRRYDRAAGAGDLGDFSYRLVSQRKGGDKRHQFTGSQVAFHCLMTAINDNAGKGYAQQSLIDRGGQRADADDQVRRVF